MAQQLWLLRHGDAEPHGTRDDHDRKLSERGVEQARAAGKALAEETPACLLIDLEAGDDAIALIERLCTDDATRDIPLAAFAGHTREDLIDAARAAGANPVVARGQAAMGPGKVVTTAIAARTQ